MKNEIRILSVVFDLGRGGVQRVAQNFSELYLDLGHISKVLVLKPGGVRETFLKSRDIEIYTEEDIEQVIQWNPDLIHVHDLGIPDQLIGQLRSALPDCITFELNTFSLPSERRNLIDVQCHMTRWCLWKYLTECKIRYQNQGTYNIILPYLNYENRFYEMSREKCNTLRDQLNIPLDAVLLGRIGQKNKSKWSEVTFSVFKQLLIENPDIYLLIVGIPDHFKNLLDRKYSELTDRIRFLDYVDTDEDLSIIYSSMDIFLHTSWLGESFGFVLAESLLCQTPIVTLSTPYYDNSQAEVVGHDVGGLVAQTEAEYLGFTNTLIRDESLRRRLGKKGREHIIKKYCENSLKSKISFLIDTLVLLPKSEWKGSLQKQFALSASGDDVLEILSFNRQTKNDYIVTFMLIWRVVIGRMLILRFGWNFLLRNYLKLFRIRHL